MPGTRRNVKPTMHVQASDSLCTIRCDKANAEVICPFDSVVGNLLVQEGQTAKVGEKLCFLEVFGDGWAESEDPDRPENLEERNCPSDDEVVKLDRIFGEDVAGGLSRWLGDDVHPLDPKSAEKQNARAGTDIKVLAVPSVRRLADEMDVNLNMIAPGSGTDGKIERKDVMAYAGRAEAKPAADQYQIGPAKALGEETSMDPRRKEEREEVFAG